MFPTQAVFFNALLHFTEDFLFGLDFACGVILAWICGERWVVTVLTGMRGWTVVSSSRSQDTNSKVSFRGVMRMRSVMWAGRSMMSW